MFDKSVRFGYPWRDYQARVLAGAQQFIQDGRLHIVAAPGSGKTVLGLELMRRIDKPTIILVPTIAIRNQWVDRFVDLFLPGSKVKPAWISTDINKPGKVTVVTYQGLASRMLEKKEKKTSEPEAPESQEVFIEPEEETDDAEAAEQDAAVSVAETLSTPVSETIYLPGEEPVEEPEVEPEPVPAPPPVEIPKLLAQLKDKGVQTIIVDEAHHLRNEWWKALIALRTGLEKSVVIALTATPPYDADALEWKRYSSFCGPVDMEVSVPELVARRELCPHQDYVYYALPSTEEIAAVKTIREAIGTFAQNLLHDQQCIAALLAHPVCNAASSERERIVLDEPDYYTAMGSFLYAAGQKKAAKPLLRLICGHSFRLLPRFDGRQLEVLLQGILYGDRLFVTEQNGALVKRLRTAAAQIGMVDGRQVTVIDNKQIARVLRNSLPKVQAIRDIVVAEQQQLGAGLRCVVLTDFIRREWLDEPHAGERTSSVGVLPIFETLRASAAKTAGLQLAVLTGTIVVIPQQLQTDFQSALQELVGKTRVKKLGVSFSPFTLDDSYVVCNVETAARQHIVAAMTALFTEGKVQCIVGTKSLLGEGWDAPAINTLVLASFVGTSMLSNQMRGRAIRVYPPEPQKTANIWHVLTIMPEHMALNPLQGKMADDLGAEYRTLKRRFASFVAPNYQADQIESGLGRASGLPAGPYVVRKLFQHAQAANAKTYALASNRSAMAESWRRALAAGKIGQITHSMETDRAKLPRGPVFFRGFAAALYAGVATFAALLPDSLRVARALADSGAGGVVLFAAIALVVTVGFALRLIVRMLRHFSPERSMQQVGEALLSTMCKYGFISTPRSGLRVETRRHTDGSVETLLVGAQPYESDLFLDALGELVSPIRNPRYLLQARGRNWWLPGGWSSFAMPSILSTKRKYVDHFLVEWHVRVGKCRGVYTRSAAGRRILLRARRSSLGAYYGEHTERHSVWS